MEATMDEQRVIVVGRGEEIKLTVQGADGMACIYVSEREGKLVLTGGSSLIERIEGEGMRDKIA